MKNRCPIYLLLLLAFCLSSISNAQSLYPVTASLRMSGPSSSRFFTFSQPGMIAGRPNRIALDLRLNDLDEPSLDVRLNWEISGSDIAFSSSDISATNIVSLVSGQFVRLDNAALSSYFQPSAFDGLSDDFLLRSDGLLPEGMYEICVTAYELTQGKQVSNMSCQIIFLEELEPPLIVTPVDEVLPTYPQNVILNWQANHLAVFPVQYTIALWEEIEGLSPDQITFQTPPLYTETVLNRTAFVFNASHPLLTPGRNYLVQVRARDNDDAYVFKNNGFSPIHRFLYGAQEDEGICEAPSAGEFGFGYGNLLVLAWNGGDLASAMASADAKAEGTASPSASGLATRASTTSVLSLSNDFGETTKKAGGFYRIRYRILGTDEWSSVDTDQLTAGIKGLRAGKTYEIEISKVCASGIVPAPIFQVTVPKLPRRLPQECGSEPSTEGFEETPIDELFVNDTIIAAGAYVRITNVVGGPAGWTGEGEVAMPFLPKSRVAVEFSNIVVNVNYELIAGYIETVYDDKMSNVVNLDAISGLFDNGPSIEQVNYAIPIDTIMQGPGGIIIVVRSDGGIDSFKAPIIVIAPGLEAVLINGYQFEVFDLDNMVDSIAPEQFTFMAHPEQKYGFDGVKKELLTEYKEEAGFVMPYKSVAFGEADKIRAVVTGDPPNDAEVHFVELSTAAALKFTRSGNEYDIITGGLKSGLSQVIALGPNGIMGMFQVMGTAKEFVTVHLVPLNGYGKNTDAQSIEKAATDILRQAGFSVRVDVLDVGLQYDGAKISLENHFASAYSPDMKQIISQLGRKVNKEAHDVYMILTDMMEGNTTGFMPKGMGIGFMELGGGGQTLAHELCHGLFNMPHIFEGFYEGKTKGSLPDNLMDYNEGTALYYRQWARMQSPGVHLAWFDDEREGKQLSAGNLDYQCISDEFADIIADEIFVNFNGKPIRLSGVGKPLAFYGRGEESIYQGRLAAIVTNNGTYLGNSLYKDEEDSTKFVFKDQFVEWIGQDRNFLTIPPLSEEFSGNLLSFIENDTSNVTFKGKIYEKALKTCQWKEISNDLAEDEKCREKYKNHPYLQDSGPLGVFVNQYPCVLGRLEHFDFSGQTRSQFADDLALIVAEMIGVPMIASFVASVLPELFSKEFMQMVLSKKIKDAGIAFNLDALIQNTVIYYFPPEDKPISWAEARNEVDLGQSAIAGLETFIELKCEACEVAIKSAIQCMYAGASKAENGEVFNNKACGIALLETIGLEIALKGGGAAIKYLGSKVPIEVFVKHLLRNANLDDVVIAGFSSLSLPKDKIYSIFKSVHGPISGTNIKALLDISDEAAAERIAKTISGNATLEKEIFESGWFVELRKAGLSGEELAKLMEDFGANLDLVLTFKGNLELLNAWQALINLPEAIRLEVKNLENLAYAMKQEGYETSYFSILIAGQIDPQKFFDDFVSLIGPNGKFYDVFTEQDYQKYLQRKVSHGQHPRDRSDWKQVSDYIKYDSPLARGNNFNRKAWEEEWYPAWEVRLDNGKYIDGYNPFTKEIISRKATDFIDIAEDTFVKYIDELVMKYAPPKIITTMKQGAIYDQLRKNPQLPSDAKLILEVPESNLTFSDLQRYKDIAKAKGVEIRFMPE